jgi:hypothetical protein
MLSLDDPRWKDRNHRGWTDGARYDLDPDAPCAPAELRKLVEGPSDIQRFQDLWPYLLKQAPA